MFYQMVCRNIINLYSSDNIKNECKYNKRNRYKVLYEIRVIKILLSIQITVLTCELSCEEQQLGNIIYNRGIFKKYVCFYK